MTNTNKPIQTNVSDFYLNTLNKVFKSKPTNKHDIKLLHHWGKVYNQTNNLNHVAKAYYDKSIH